MPNRKPYPSDVSDEEWAFVAPYLALVREDAPQRTPELREIFDGLRWVVRTGSPWRYYMPNDLPPWETPSTSRPEDGSVPGFSRRWCMRSARTLAAWPRAETESPRPPYSTAGTLRSTPESGPRAGYDGAKRKRGSKIRAAVETLGHLLALHVTPVDEQDREQVEVLADAIQEATGENVELAYVDQGYSGERRPATDAEERGIRLEMIERPEAERGFALLPRRRVVERGFAWASRFRRLVKDYERLPATVAGLHFVAFACLFLHRAVAVLGPSPELKGASGSGWNSAPPKSAVIAPGKMCCLADAQSLPFSYH